MFNWFKSKTPEPAPPSDATHAAAMPKAATIGMFIPVESFEGFTPEGELLGVYKKGNRYSIRKGNDMLIALCAQWRAENKITLIGSN